MRKILVYLSFAAFLLLASSQAGWYSFSFAASKFQLECIEQVIGDTEIIANQALDVDQDNMLDQVALYGKDNLYIIVALNRSSVYCEIALNERLSALKLVNPTAWRTIEVRKIEIIEVTGDDKPELHIWLNKTGASPRYEHAVHIIYTPTGEGLQEVFATEQCLSFSTFEFRDGPRGGAKNIYLDTDIDCQPPWSYQRTYTIMRWDGVRFVPNESGTVDIFTTDPPWLNVFCIVVPVSFMIILALVVIRWRRQWRGETIS